MKKSTTRKPSEVKTVNLALQGGGAHGSFTWGVLDRFLEDERIIIDAISGTSAGAMNATVLAHGMTKNGRDGAREALASFWKQLSKHNASNSFIQRSSWDRMTHGWNLDNSPIFQMFDLMTRVMSPYELNPSGFHPLRELLNEQIDFDILKNGGTKVKLFISTTNVNTGKVRVFDDSELNTEVLLASACLPYMFKAIEIEGQAYWDGGFMGNPSIFPLIYGSKCQDVIVVQINPFTRDTVPTTAREILDRANEISFNSSLMREMRAIAFVASLIEEEGLDPKKYKRLNVHLIEAEEKLRNLGFASKLNADWDFLCYLHDLGRDSANAWLEENFQHLGKRTTVDIKDKFV